MPLPAKTSGLTPAVADLGMGDMLGKQATDETEETRKKRMKEMADRQMMGPSGSLATTMLLGGSGGNSA